MKCLIGVIYVFMYMALGVGLTLVFDADYPTIMTFLTLGAVCGLLAESDMRKEDD